MFFFQHDLPNDFPKKKKNSVSLYKRCALCVLHFSQTLGQRMLVNKNINLVQYFFLFANKKQYQKQHGLTKCPIPVFKSDFQSSTLKVM